MKSLAVILPRYGESLGGGAEALVKSLIEHIRLAPEGFSPIDRVEVWTTCARDHRTWENHYPEGESLENGILVKRFSVNKRDLETFLRVEIAIQEGRATSLDDQLDWLSESVNSNGLYKHIIEEGPNFDCLLFAPYLFATTFWGSLIYPEKSVLVPCLHNEAYAYLPVFHHLFSSVRGLICNADAERELFREVYGFSDLEEKSSVVGMGFDPIKSQIENEESKLFSLRGNQKPYLLYSGRKEQGKNVDLLIDSYMSYRKNVSRELDLVLIGAGDIAFLDELPEGVIDYGFVSEEEKAILMRNAVALCQPSTNESFSIVLMEAWLQKTPVIVHGACDVTKEHVLKSGGGLHFSNQKEFELVVDELVSKPDFAKAAAINGERYVQEEYSWNAVLERLYKSFKKFGFFKEDEQRSQSSN